MPRWPGADVGLTITTLQGPIRLGDYLRTRCVVGVVHGMDLAPPVAPDPTALATAVDALMGLLRVRDLNSPPPASSRPRDSSTSSPAAPPLPSNWQTSCRL